MFHSHHVFEAGRIVFRKIRKTKNVNVRFRSFFKRQLHNSTYQFLSYSYTHTNTHIFSPITHNLSMNVHPMTSTNIEKRRRTFPLFLKRQLHNSTTHHSLSLPFLHTHTHTLITYNSLSNVHPITSINQHTDSDVTTRARTIRIC